MRRKPVSDWTMDELKQILQRVRMALGEEDYKVMNAVVETLSLVRGMPADSLFPAPVVDSILAGAMSERGLVQGAGVMAFERHGADGAAHRRDRRPQPARGLGGRHRDAEVGGTRGDVVG